MMIGRHTYNTRTFANSEGLVSGAGPSLMGWYLFGAFLALVDAYLVTPTEIAPGQRWGALVPIWCPFGAYPEPRPIETSLRALASRKDALTKVSQIWKTFGLQTR